MNSLPDAPPPDESQPPQQAVSPAHPQWAQSGSSGYPHWPQHPQTPGVQAPITGVQMSVTAQTRTNGTAVAAMITGVALLVFAFPSACFAGTPFGLILLTLTGLGSIIPIVLGAVALRRIPHTQEGGKGLAIAGMVTGSIAGVWVLFVMLAWMYVASGDDSSIFYTLLTL